MSQHQAQHSYSYYDNVSSGIIVTFIFLPVAILTSLFFLVLILTMIIGKFYLNRVLYKIFFSSFFVSATIIVAQIFFGAGAIKQKKRNPPVLVISGRQYKLSGFVLGTIVYYNCAVIYVIIGISIYFIYRQIPWSLEACQSSVDCFYLNYSTVVTQYDNPTATRIINCIHLMKHMM